MPSRVLFCPKCDLGMTALREGSVVVDECPECKGIWFDHGELRRYRRHRKLPVQSNATFANDWNELALPPLVCPRCDRSTLEAGKVRTVRVLRCSQCRGVYLSKWAAARSHVIMKRIRTHLRDLSRTVSRGGDHPVADLLWFLSYFFP